jgi:2-polyprenyl-3-methyl-5-hydroxy-6-metoxy-1,4-benzoquinol methylase
MKNIGIQFNFENTYGHGRRIRFIRNSIQDYCNEKGKDKNQIKILDIGCGTGIGITFPVASLGYSITGVDVDKDSINLAQEKNIYPNANFACGFLEELSNLKDFDIIICSEVLEHVSRPEEFLTVIKSRLKPGGIIILTVPNGYGWFEIEKFIYDKFGLKYLSILLIKLKSIIISKNTPSFITLNTLNKADVHLQHFSWLKINELFKKTDFIILDKKGAFIFGGPISETFLKWCKPFLNFNDWLANKMSIKMTIGWYFVLTHKK